MADKENSFANVPSQNDDSESCNLDAVLIRIGQFGTFQMRSFALVLLPMIFNAYFLNSYIFVGSSLAYRCKVPECDGPNSGYQEPWTDFTIPTKSNGDLDKCYRYVPLNRSSDMCFADNYDQDSKESCGKDFIFRDNEISISNDFDIYCSEEWQLSLVGTISVAGQFVGAPVGGFFSDRYGRRTVVAIGGFVIAILGIARSFSLNYLMFLILAFFEHLCGGIIFSTLFIIGLELVSQRARDLTGLILAIVFSFGEILLALSAKYVHNWRWVLRIGYMPALAHITLLWLLPESVRWLLSRGNEEKAAEVLQKAAKTNKRKLSDVTIGKLFLENRYQLEKGNQSKFPIKEAFKAFPLRIFNCMLCWFSIFLVFHGLNVNSQLLGGNKYHNFIYSALVEIPGNIIVYFTMSRFGRRFTMFGSLLICGICLGSTIFIPKDFYILQLTLFLFGKLVISISFQVLYFFTSEIFPTNARNSLLSFCLMAGKIGLMSTPQTVHLAKLNKSAPSILFAIVAAVAGFVSLLLPETANAVLPSTINEAEQIGQKKKEAKQES